jgi:hypothetical protein
MAVQTTEEFKNGGATSYAITIEYLQASDIKVRIGGTLQTYVTGTPGSGEYSVSGTTVTLGAAAPAGSGNVHIYRETDVNTAAAVFAAGSSIRAADLNAIHDMGRFAAVEHRNKIITANIKAGAITSTEIADGTIVDADINSSAAISGSKLQPSTGSNAGSMSAADKAKLDGIESGATADQTAAEIRTLVESATDSNVFTDADHTKLNGIEAGATQDQTAAEIKTLLTANKLEANQLAANSVTTSQIQDAELTTLASMQSGTASVLADSTALTASTAELNQLDGITLETSLTGTSDTRIPTSKAVNDQILAVTNALGGFVAIADETSFPATNPDPSNGAGTVVSISQLSSGTSVSVDQFGVATITNGAGTGNDVTITGFPATLRQTNLAADSGLQVQTTTTLHTYTFHKQLASAADIQAISATVNSFSNRYRVSASAPTSSLDGGDLWYDTANSKLMVYSSQDSAWEETTAIGNFFISTLSLSTATGGGSATPNGTAYRFTVSNAPTSAQQLLVSVDGVIQKPNAGTTQPSEGFALSGNDIIFSTPPVNGANIFITTLGSTVGIGTPSNNTVTTAILQNASVATAKIADDAVTQAKIADDAVGADQLASNSVVSASIVDGSIVNADVNASAAIAGTKITPDFGSQAIITDGINLQTSNNNDTFKGTSANGIKIASSSISLQQPSSPNNNYAVFNNNGCDLRVANAQKLVVNSSGTAITGNLDVSSGVDVTGNITVTGTVDGRDVAADGTKLDTVETNAKDDQTAAEIKTLLNSNQLVTAQFANDSITADKIADDAVNDSKLSHTGVTAGTYGTASAIPALTINTQGRITAASTNAVSIPAGIPAGAVMAFAQTTAPSGWLICNGTAISRTSYAALFAAIGTTYGAGDGSSTFNLPELRGEFIRGLDNGRGIDSSRANGSFQDHGIPALKGMFYDVHGGSRMSVSAVSGYTNPFVGNSASSWRTLINNVYGNYFYIELDSTRIIPDATHVRPRNVAMTYMIKI